jgi:hypothetical protein
VTELDVALAKALTFGDDAWGVVALEELELEALEEALDLDIMEVWEADVFVLLIEDPSGVMENSTFCTLSRLKSSFNKVDM